MVRGIAIPAEAYRSLHNVAFFREWPEELLMNAAASCTVIDARADQDVVRQGQVLDGLYVIASGEIAIGVQNRDGRRYVRRYAGRDQVYGLVSMFDGKPTPQFFSTRVTSRLIFVPKAVVLEALQRHPVLWWGVVDWWTEMHRGLLAGLHEMAFDTLRVRLVRSLLAYARQFGMHELPATPLELRINQEELARLLGMTRQSVSREVKGLERDGLIEIVYGGLVLKAPHELVRLVELGSG